MCAGHASHGPPSAPQLCGVLLLPVSLGGGRALWPALRPPQVAEPLSAEWGLCFSSCTLVPGGWVGITMQWLQGVCLGLVSACGFFLLCA